MQYTLQCNGCFLDTHIQVVAQQRLRCHRITSYGLPLTSYGLPTAETDVGIGGIQICNLSLQMPGLWVHHIVLLLLQRLHHYSIIAWDHKSTPIKINSYEITNQLPIKINSYEITKSTTCTDLIPKGTWEWATASHHYYIIHVHTLRIDTWAYQH